MASSLLNEEDTNNCSIATTAADHAASCCSASAACLPMPAAIAAAGVATGQCPTAMPPPCAAASCSLPSSFRSTLRGTSGATSPCAVSVVVATLGLVALVVLVSAMSTASIGRSTAVVVDSMPTTIGAGGTVAAGASPQSLAFLPSAAGRIVASGSISRQEQLNKLQPQINALQARMDQLQYDFDRLQYATTAAAASGDWTGQLQQQQEVPPAMWPPFLPSGDAIDYYYHQHPKSMLARRHISWQPMRRDIVNEDDDNARSVAQRHVNWQPMKRHQQEYGIMEDQQQPHYGIMGGEAAADDAVHIAAENGARKEQVMRTVEQQLVEVLSAGDRLGVSADQILAHLRRTRGGGTNAGGAR